MSEERVEHGGAPSEEQVVALMDVQRAFGPSFFVKQLHAFVRDRCPDPAEHLPVVLLHLVDGEVLDVCHVIGLTRSWVALAIREGERASAMPEMRTELVPYEAIHRVTVRAVRPTGTHIGFDPVHEPQLYPEPAAERSPEAALRAAAGVEPRPGGIP